jgi:hypothetical protein
MNTIEKVSEITYSEVANYIRLDEITQDEINTLNNLIRIAKAYIMQYTGRTEDELDDYPDFVIVVLILCQDMWDNRALYVDKTNLNYVVESILSLHAVNLL